MLCIHDALWCLLFIMLVMGCRINLLLNHPKKMNAAVENPVSDQIPE